MAQSQRPSSTIPPIGSNKRAGPAGHSDKAHLAVGAQCDGDRVRLCRRLAFGASLGIIQLVHLSLASIVAFSTACSRVSVPEFNRRETRLSH